MYFEQLNDSACRTYLIGCPETREAAIVDPLIANVELYRKRLRDGGFSLRYVIDTHSHADHVSGGVLLSERTDAEYLMHRRAGANRANRRLTDGERLLVGRLGVDVIETPGHTKDSLSLQLDGRILTGDWLFIGGAGRTDLPGGDAGEHWDSLARVLPNLSDDILVFPGHDYQDKTSSSLGAERKANVNLEPPRSREEYVRWLARAKQPTPEWMIETLKANREGVTDPTVDFMPEGAESACMCQPAPSPGIASVTVEEVHAMLDDDEERLLLDVRQPEEFEGELGHVPGATSIPLGELSARLSEIASYRDKTVVAICRSGGRSAKACGILEDAGFEKVLNMTGGTLAWNDRGYAVER